MNQNKAVGSAWCAGCGLYWGIVVALLMVHVFMSAKPLAADGPIPVNFAATRTFDVGGSPQSVVEGDFNGDGIADLAVANEFSNDVSVLLGNGDGTFRAAVNYGVGLKAKAVALGDLNGDGTPDLVVANTGSNSVSILLGNGDGTFRSTVNYTVGTGPFSVVVGEFNGDQKLDLALSNNGDNSVSVLLGNGDGSFRGATSYAVGTSPSSVAAGDFNGDGRLDLVVANNGANSVSILLANGEGTFQPATTYVTGLQPTDAASGDFNGDGKLDLAVANGSGSTVSILMGKGDGTFQLMGSYSAGYLPFFVAVGDFNGDRKLDLAVPDQRHYQVTVLLGNGDGTFQSPVQYPVGFHPSSIVAGDFSSDGKLDLAVTNYGSDTVSILLGNGDGTFQVTPIYGVALDSPPPATGDFNGDGKLDLVVADNGNKNLYALVGNGDGTFHDGGGVTMWSMHASFLGVGDFDGDGKPDAAVLGDKIGLMRIFLGNGDGSFRVGANYPFTTQPATSLAVGDFNGDGKSDVAVTQLDSVLVYLGSGDGTLQPATSYGVGSRPVYVVIGDFNRDGVQDIVTANSYDGSVSILLGKGDGTFRSAVNYGAGNYPSTVAVGDFNDDGNPDLAVANQGSVDLAILMGNGDGTFRAPGYVKTPGTDFVAAGDFNGDGKLDLALTYFLGSSVPILLGRGDGTFQTPVNFGVGPTPLNVVVGDFNKDGRPDLAVPDLNGSLSILLNTSSGGGPISPVLSLSTQALSSTAVPGSTLSFGLTITNGGTTPANVVLQDALPAGSSFREVFSPLPWSCAIPLSREITTITCSNPAMPPGKTDTLTLTVNVNCGLTNGSLLSNTATINNATPPMSTATVAVLNPAAVVSPTHQVFGPAGGAGVVQVSSSSLCGWAAASNASFISINGPGTGSGNGKIGYIVAPNTTTTLREGTITISGATFTVTQTPTGETMVSALSGGGATSLTSGAGSSVQAGYATLTQWQLKTDREEATAGGLYSAAVFSLTQNGAVVSEVGVPASPPTTAARIFVDYRTDVQAKRERHTAGTFSVDTGLAVVNLGSTPASLLFTLRGPDGSVTTVGHGTLAAGAHWAQYLDQLKDMASDFVLPENFSTATQFGTLEIRSDLPVSILGLRLLVNQRGETLLTSTPIIDLAGSLSTNTLYFPQMADGGGYHTMVVLVNTTAVTEAGTLQLLDDNGGPLTVHQSNGATNSSFPYDIAPHGVYVFQTDGSPASVNAGSVRIVPNGINLTTPVGAGVFSFETSGGLMVTQSGVPSAAPTTHARIYVDLSGGHDTGLAVTNSGSQLLPLTLQAFQADGVTPVGTSSTITLPANGHISSFAGQLITGLPAGFSGVVDLSSSLPFAALTLRSLTNIRGDFLLTLFPIADYTQPAPAPIVFPQIAAGGGYQTQIIVLNTDPNTRNILVSYFDDKGNPLDVVK